MKVAEKINMTREELEKYGPINIVAFGDSVTHGAFSAGEIDYERVYWNVLRKKINDVRNYVPVNVINAGIGGVSAKTSLSRVDLQVLAHNPDLVIVCFGLNDVMNGMDGLSAYTKALTDIFVALKNAGIETIFMTPNMMNTEISVHLERETPRKVAKETMTAQMEGIMDAYINAAIEVCEKNGVVICDCYSRWKKLSDAGVNTTNLLANHINHPTREMNWLFAVSLIETMLEI